MELVKDLNYWKSNAEEDYLKVPISVLRYISELEKVVAKDLIKPLTDIKLCDPAHLSMESNGHGEFPDSYKLTKRGIDYIIEQIK